MMLYNVYAVQINKKVIAFDQQTNNPTKIRYIYIDIISYPTYIYPNKFTNPPNDPTPNSQPLVPKHTHPPTTQPDRYA